MTRIIKASEVKPGMEVQWTSLGITRRCTGEVVDAGSPRDGVNLRTSEGGAVHIPGDAEVTVLTEPQPEEPTAFGARVVADGHEFLLSHGGRRSWKARLDGKRYAWTDLCEMGSVVVIDATPSWTLPAQATETPVVPERIEEWPEADEHLRKHKWRDMDGDTWTWAKAEDKWECRSRADIRMGASRRPGSWFGPFTRVTDA